MPINQIGQKTVAPCTIICCWCRLIKLIKRLFPLTHYFNYVIVIQLKNVVLSCKKPTFQIIFCFPASRFILVSGGWKPSEANISLEQIIFIKGLHNMVRIPYDGTLNFTYWWWLSVIHSLKLSKTCVSINIDALLLIFHY